MAASECEVAISRPGNGEEIVIEVRIPGERKIRVAMSPADFALALTGRGGCKAAVDEVKNRARG